MSVIAGPEGPGSGRRGPASRVSLGDLAARSRASADAKRVRARTWSWPRARLVKCPSRRNRPSWIPHPAGPIASWGRLSSVLGGYLHRMRVWDPFAGSCVGEVAVALRTTVAVGVGVDGGGGGGVEDVEGVRGVTMRAAVLAWPE
jgi:hypothetical protein